MNANNTQTAKRVVFQNPERPFFLNHYRMLRTARLSIAASPLPRKTSCIKDRSFLVAFEFADRLARLVFERVASRNHASTMRVRWCHKRTERFGAGIRAPRRW